MTVDALVFDFDGLILDTETSAFTTAADVFTAHGLALDREWWLTIIGTADHRHWSEVLEEALGSPIAEREAVLAARRARHYELILEESARPGVDELTAAAQGASVPCAVASSSPRQWVDEHLERLGLRPRFAALCCRDDVPVGRTKPAPDLFLGACEMVSASPARSVALEDSPNGLMAAQAAGLVTVGVPAGMTATLDLSVADMVVSSLLDVDLDPLTKIVEARQPGGGGGGDDSR
ncbi:MAG: HAD family hydrolase [Acidimicrobiales bacterium]